MTDTVALMVVQVRQADDLAAIFGQAAVEQALADFDREMDVMAKRLLAKHAIVEAMRREGDASWTARFRVVSGGLPRDAEETCGALEAAARKLVHAALVQIFGIGTGMRVDVGVAVRPLPPDRTVAADWIDRQIGTIAGSGIQEPDISRAEVEAVMDGRRLRTLLQPIVAMADRRRVGFEALSRGPAGSRLEPPDVLFDAAHAHGRHEELELLCAELALARTRGRMPPGTFLTINLGPDALARAPDVLSLDRRDEVVFEITEHMPLDQAEGLTGAATRLRGLGLGLALDDTGCGFADLDTARVLAPEIVKLCITVVRNSDKGDRFLDAIAETTRHLQNMGSKVLAEGVETEAQHEALLRCGIDLAQGWLYGRPVPVDEVLGGG